MTLPVIRKPFEGNYPITQKFGEARDWYIKIAGYPHNGIDFAMPDGMSIYACANGTISYADNTPDGDGLGINIRHEWGLSQYWHLSKLNAILGQDVKKGDPIGYSGHSGWATGPHLHFGTKVTGQGEPNMRGWYDPALLFGEAPVAPQPPVITPRTYIVRPGDSLWKIAVKYYGSGIYWRKIYDANKDKIANPNIIKVFQVLTIPK